MTQIGEGANDALLFALSPGALTALGRR